MRCPLCGSQKLNLQFSKRKYDFYKCKNCTLIFQFPISKKEIADYYANHYYNLERPIEQFSNYFVNQKDKLILNLIKRHKPSGSLLDIGAGYGVFVKNARKEEFKATGIEPNKSSVKLALQKFNITLDCQFFNKNYNNGKKFDIITLFHVIEHVLNPGQLIKNASSKLNNGGLLVLETPNINSFNARRMGKNWPFVLPNEHLFYFSYESLNHLLKNEGFKIIYKQRLGPFIHRKSEIMTQEIRSQNPKASTKIIKVVYDFISKNLILGDHILIIARKI